eukprot:TRINITY_DN2528_c0_g1_i1.p2 TRINITY_DN2528_c0_g1~~TRINITY_DN2528_c0_g1_i1.p2  ORF type:complete len:646 (+),score=264.88 TRINITY_DN2528_c0_g1_i1:90-2027(+)
MPAVRRRRPAAAAGDSHGKPSQTDAKEPAAAAGPPAVDGGLPLSLTDAQKELRRVATAVDTVACCDLRRAPAEGMGRLRALMQSVDCIRLADSGPAAAEVADSLRKLRLIISVLVDRLALVSPLPELSIDPAPATGAGLRLNAGWDGLARLGGADDPSARGLGPLSLGHADAATRAASAAGGRIRIAAARRRQPESAEQLQQQLVAAQCSPVYSFKDLWDVLQLTAFGVHRGMMSAPTEMWDTAVLMDAGDVEAKAAAAAVSSSAAAPAPSTTLIIPASAVPASAKARQRRQQRQQRKLAAAKQSADACPEPEPEQEQEPDAAGQEQDAAARRDPQRDGRAGRAESAAEQQTGNRGKSPMKVQAGAAEEKADEEAAEEPAPDAAGKTVELPEADKLQQNTAEQALSLNDAAAEQPLATSNDSAGNAENVAGGGQCTAVREQGNGASEPPLNVNEAAREVLKWANCAGESEEAQVTFATAAGSNSGGSPCGRDALKLLLQQMAANATGQEAAAAAAVLQRRAQQRGAATGAENQSINVGRAHPTPAAPQTAAHIPPANPAESDGVHVTLRAAAARKTHAAGPVPGSASQSFVTGVRSGSSSDEQLLGRMTPVEITGYLVFFLVFVTPFYIFWCWLMGVGHPPLAPS